MALRRPPTTFSDQITDADIGADSIGTSELKDDAVETANIKDSTGASDGITAAKIATDAVVAAKIATGAVVADGIGAGAVVAAGIGTGAVVEAKLGTGAVTSAKIANDAIEVKPHIKPGMLYPALKDTGGAVRQTDGVTAVVASTVGPAGSAIASSLYGTVQSDGKMYYYTDIKGSKPIKDPRIGAHFGGQRHTFKSLQFLEQETTTYGEEIFSIDGRENIRVGNFPAGSNYMRNTDRGLYLSSNRANTFLEITGYFNDFNLIFRNYTASSRTLAITVNGVTAHAALDLKSTSASPLIGRFVDGGSVRNIDITSASSLSSDTALGINTIKFTFPATDIDCYGCELIAQDTTSATTRNQIQIQPQNVVSYGKRFAIDDTALHYNPFAFKTDGSTAWASGDHNLTVWPVGTGSSHNIDTATSLGLDKWLHSSNYYKPYNGGRVVIWVDSSGNIKTSVTVMPPNARSILTTAITAKANASVANNTYLPTFEAGNATAYESTALAEIAKTFHWREFGNGAVNGGTGHSNYADASMLHTTTDDIAYVMDDGLTSFSLLDSKAWENNVHPANTNDWWYLTFIGTGITIKSTYYAPDTHNIAQNLQYGTHILKGLRPASGIPVYTIDGVTITMASGQTYADFEEVSIHQPKMPPIPENAVVIADYMLMADYVEQTGDPEGGKISKGVRSCCGGRDVFADDSSWTNTARVDTANVGPWGLYGFRSGSRATAKLPYFGTAVNTRMQDTSLAQVLTIDGGSAITTTARDNGSEATRDMRTMSVANSGVAIGSHTVLMTSSASYVGRFIGFDVVSPIHTSSHYQTFESPHLHELVGGDRNMEQTNLVVTPDGKTWDELRDTSYIGTTCIETAGANSSQNAANAHPRLHTRWRGLETNLTWRTRNWCNKDFAIAYNHVICLVDGCYEFTFRIRILTAVDGAGALGVVLNDHGTGSGTTAHIIWQYNSDVYEFHTMTVVHQLKRGDTISWQGPEQDPRGDTVRISRLIGQ